MLNSSSSSPRATSEVRSDVLKKLRLGLQEFFAPTPEVRKVLIFGSWASDSWRPTSDVDLLIVLDDASAVDWHQRWRYFPLNLDWPADCLVLSEREIASMLAEKNSFMSSVLERALLVYEAGQ